MTAEEISNHVAKIKIIPARKRYQIKRVAGTEAILCVEPVGAIPGEPTSGYRVEAAWPTMQSESYGDDGYQHRTADRYGFGSRTVYRAVYRHTATAEEAGQLLDEWREQIGSLARKVTDPLAAKLPWSDV